MKIAFCIFLTEFHPKSYFEKSIIQWKLHNDKSYQIYKLSFQIWLILHEFQPFLIWQGTPCKWPSVLEQLNLCIEFVWKFIYKFGLMYISYKEMLKICFTKKDNYLEEPWNVPVIQQQSSIHVEFCFSSCFNSSKIFSDVL